MKKRLTACLLSLVLCLLLLPVSAGAADLPGGWWPLWSAYTEAVESGDGDAILRAGDAVIRLYRSVPLNTDIAGGLYMVYYTRMTRQLYEARCDYTAAAENVQSLLDICDYLNSMGRDYRDMQITCQARLRLLTPMLEVYAASYTRRSAYENTSAPASGCWYGSIVTGGFAASGQASIVSAYVEVETETARQFNYLIAPFADSGKQALLLNLNFKEESATAAALPDGRYDSGLRTTLQYLNTLECPVLLRIGGEMNVWEQAVEPAVFRRAYEYVASLARELAPRVELVWSPNSVSAWGADVEDYYPAEEYVDWVGLSLYYSYDSANSSPVWIEYVGSERFASPVRAARQVVEVGRAHGKPVIATEGGAMVNGSQGRDYARQKVAEQFALVPMVYPEVKAMLYFDKAHDGHDYTLTGEVMEAVQAAIAANPALLDGGEASAATYVPLDQFQEAVTDRVLLGAAGSTYYSAWLPAAYALDGRPLPGAGDTANHCVLELCLLSAGKHRLDVTFTDTAGWTGIRTYTLAYSGTTLSCSPGWNEADPLPDAPAGWAEKDVTEALRAGLVPAALRCRYSEATTRAEFCALATALYEAKCGAIQGRIPFPDTQDEAVEKMAFLKVVNGVGGGRFDPDAPLTREQAATMLTRLADAMGYPLPVTEPGFADLERISGWAFDAVGQMAGSGIMQGVGNNRFDPAGSYQRQQSILTLLRLFRLLDI